MNDQKLMDKFTKVINTSIYKQRMQMRKDMMENMSDEQKEFFEKAHKGNCEHGKGRHDNGCCGQHGHHGHHGHGRGFGQFKGHEDIRLKIDNALKEKLTEDEYKELKESMHKDMDKEAKKAMGDKIEPILKEALTEEEYEFYSRFKEMRKRGHMGGHRPPMQREKILYILVDYPDGISQKALAEVLHIKPQSVSELIVKLEKDELITREKNENDKREVLIFLTEKGRERGDFVKNEREKSASEFFAKLDENEKETLDKILDKLLS